MKCFRLTLNDVSAPAPNCSESDTSQSSAVLKSLAPFYWLPPVGFGSILQKNRLNA
ncbi:MAG: hypothetical protein ACK5CA_06265 [Cyanobacteriota bacterium]